MFQHPTVEPLWARWADLFEQPVDTGTLVLHGGLLLKILRKSLGVFEFVSGCQITCRHQLLFEPA